MLFFLLSLIILGVNLYFIYFFSNKINLQKKQIVLLKRQSESFKNKNQNRTKNIDIKFINCSIENGTIIKECYIHLYPSNTSPSIYKLTAEDIVNIHCCAEVLTHTWYEISCFPKGMINTRGWVKKDFLHLNL